MILVAETYFCSKPGNCELLHVIANTPLTKSTIYSAVSSTSGSTYVFMLTCIKVKRVSVICCTTFGLISVFYLIDSSAVVSQNRKSLLPFIRMKVVYRFTIALIIAVVIINIESAPVDPKKSTEKPSDANGVENAAGVSNILFT